MKATNCDVSMPTEELIAICLGVIKSKAVAQLRSSRAVELDESKIRWVITVPAIWVSFFFLFLRHETFTIFSSLDIIVQTLNDTCIFRTYF